MKVLWQEKKEGIVSLLVLVGVALALLGLLAGPVLYHQTAIVASCARMPESCRSCVPLMLYRKKLAGYSKAIGSVICKTGSMPGMIQTKLVWMCNARCPAGCQADSCKG